MGGEGLQRPHAFHRIADEGDEADVITPMVLACSSPDSDFEVEVSAPEGKKSYDPQAQSFNSGF